MSIQIIKSLTKEEAMAVQLLRRVTDDHEQQKLIWRMEGWIWGLEEKGKERILLERLDSEKIISFPNGKF